MRGIFAMLMTAILVFTASVSGASAQYLSDTERALIWQREQERAIRQQREAEIRLERQRAQNYYGGYNNNYYLPNYNWNPPRRHSNGNTGAALAGGLILGLALGAIVNAPQQGSYGWQQPQPSMPWCTNQVKRSCIERIR